MLLLVLGLRLLVASEAGNGAADSAADAVRDALAEVAQLALGLLGLTLLVLAGALLLERLVADQIAEGLLARADSLVPRALGAVRVVLGDARGGDGEGAGLGRGVGEVVLGLGLGLLVLGFLLQRGVSEGWFEGMGGAERTLSAGLPVTAPMADWTALVAEST